MKLSCPACGFAAGLEAYIADAEWREAVLAAAALPGDCGVQVVHYVGMFRPGKRSLTPDRAARLFREVHKMITEGVDFDRQHIEAPSHIWRAALIQVLDSPSIQRPLKSHGYLLRVVQGLLARRDDYEQTERHRQRRHAPHINTGPRPIQGHCEAGGRGNPDDGPDPLASLPEGQRKKLEKKARESLVKSGVKPAFLIRPLIEARMRELLAMKSGDRGGKGDS